MPPAAKATGQYINSILAKIEAVEDGYDEAILLDTRGFISEGSGENIFVVRGGKIYTPSTAASILEGITRDSVISLAGDLGYSLTEKDLVRSDLYWADEVFFTGTAAEIVPIREIDGRLIGQPGPITRSLQEAFYQVIRGENPKYQDWLEHV